jgi:hypothetical protein
MPAIDTSTLVNWLVSGLIGLVLGFASAWVTHRYQRQRDDVGWEREKAKLEEQFEHDKEMLELQFQQRIKELEQKLQHDQGTALRAELTKGIDNPDEVIGNLQRAKARIAGPVWAGTTIGMLWVIITVAVLFVAFSVGVVSRAPTPQPDLIVTRVAMEQTASARVTVLALSPTMYLTYTPYPPAFTIVRLTSTPMVIVVTATPTATRTPTLTLPSQVLCPYSIKQGQIDSWKIGATDVSTVQSYIDRFNSVRLDNKGTFVAGDKIPSGVLVATNFDEKDATRWTQFPVTAIVHYGSWGLFQTKAEYTAPSAGACLSIVP